MSLLHLDVVWEVFNIKICCLLLKFYFNCLSLPIQVTNYVRRKDLQPNLHHQA